MHPDKRLRIGAALVALSYLLVFFGSAHSQLARALHGQGHEEELGFPLAIVTLAGLVMCARTLFSHRPAA